MYIQNYINLFLSSLLRLKLDLTTKTNIYRELQLIDMTMRRRVYTGSTSPRYRAKMFDYMGRGGRIPATLTMEVVDAMDDARAKNFGYYSGIRETEFARYLDEYGVPNILRGAATAALYAFLKLARRMNVRDTAGRTELMDFIMKIHGIADVPKLSDALRAFAAGEPIETTGEIAGGATPKT